MYLALDAQRHRPEVHHHPPRRRLRSQEGGPRAGRLAGWIVGVSGAVLAGLAVLVSLPTPPGA